MISGWTASLSLEAVTLSTAAFALVGVLAGVIGKYLIDKRSTSGAIDTSEAVTLWTESTTIRNELRTEIVGLRTQLIAATASIADLLHQIEASHAATLDSREETRLSRAETKALQASIDSVAKQVTSVHTEVTTGNAQTIAQLADNAEYRRIQEVPESDRTDAERGHSELGIQAGDHRD